MPTGTQKGLAPVKFKIDAAASRFTVQTFATGLLSAFGHNPTIAIRDYDAEIQFNSDTIDNGSVRVTVRTSVMEVVDEMKNDDRKKLDAFIAANGSGVADDVDGDPVFLAKNEFYLGYTRERAEGIAFSNVKDVKKKA